MEAQLVTAPGDGISPALLLTLGDRLKGQYLFNAPEGFARFVLEHKVRPSSNLRAVFATDLPSLVRRGTGLWATGVASWAPMKWGPSSSLHLMVWQAVAACAAA
jgi:hypothetical protein